MAVDYYKNKTEDMITLAELDLYHRIMKYRKANDLPAIQLSKGLTITAGRHALDSVENMGVYSGHNWSDAPFDSGNSSTYPNMWEAPKRLNTSYQGDGIAFYGYEITTGFSGAAVTTATMTPAGALANWQGSSAHNDVILNLNTWSNNDWKALGVGMLKGIAHVWFGESVDPGGPPKIVGEAGGDAISGTAFRDIIAAAGGHDRLKGGKGDDFLDGGKGNDVLEGQDGNDRLFGGKGADTLVGGKGADSFEFRKPNESTVQATGRDKIKDFKRSQNDKIDLSRMDADKIEDGNQDFTFIGKSKFSGEAGELRYVVKNGDTFVYGDVNGDKKADFAIRVDASVDLVKGDFAL